jgi:pimeloyl-ACP methyl ester carboxylesterase
VHYQRDDSTTLESAVQEALAQTQQLRAARYIIVAHSLGGVIGIELARQLGDKLAGFIAISATIPAPGKSFVNTMPAPQKFILPLILKLAGTKPPASAIRKGLCSDLTDAQTTEIVDAFTPEPRSLYTDKTAVSALPATRYLYIRTLHDKELLPAQQLRMAHQLPGAELATIPAGHLPMLSCPDELASAINTFSAGL